MPLAMIPVDLIRVERRLRLVGEPQVARLMDSIADVGLLNPITVFRRKVVDANVAVDGFGLVAGAHRLEAVRRLGLADIAAQVVELSELERQIAECDENLCSTVLSAAERALFTRRRQEAYEALHGPAKAIGANAANASMGRDATANLAVAFTEDTAAKIGQSVRVIRRDSERGAKIGDDDLRAIRGTGLDTGVYLDAVKSLPEQDRSAAIREDLARLSIDDQASTILETADPKALAKVAKEIRAARQAEKANRRQEREKALGAKVAALPERKYGVIIADPEWKYSVWSRETGGDKLPDNHYPTSELDTIKARDVGSIAADDCVLFLWVVAPFLDAGLDVLKAWGFDFVTCLVWNKVYPGDRHGLGYWFRVDHEIVLVGKRGEPPCPAQGTQFPSIFSAPVGEHSAKPDRVHEIAEAYFPSFQKIELNARRKRPGWDAWGNEAEGEQLEAVEPPAVSEAPAVVVAAPNMPISAGLTVQAMPDADVVRVIGASVADALRNGASLRTGDSRLHTAEERLIRRHVIRIAFDAFSISFPRLAAVLGGSKQASAQLRAAAAGEVAEDPDLAARLANVVSDVARRAGR